MRKKYRTGQEGDSLKFTLKEDGKKLLVVCIASFLMAVNIKSFVHTGGLYPGGVTGLTLLIQRAAENFLHIGIPFTLINVILNMIPVYIGFRFIGKKFTLYSCLVIVLTSVLTDIIPGHAITYDVLLIAIFGGLINGFVISLCLIMDTTTGGTDFIAIYLSEKKGIDSFNIILGINVIILAAAGIMFGWDKALYSIIFQFASTQVIRMMDPDGRRMTLFIVTGREKAGGVCAQIQDTRHTATLIEGVGLYNGEPCVMIYSVVGSNQLRRLTRKVKQADPQAFVNVIRTEKLMGNFYRDPRE